MKVATYLTLWHGRKTPDENLDDWGSNGPTFGPFEEVTVTYGAHVKASKGDCQAVLTAMGKAAA